MGEKILGGLFKKRSRFDGLVGVNLDTQSVSLAHVVGAQDKGLALKVSDVREARGAQAQQDVLSAIVDEHQLEGATTNFVLNPSQYSLLLVEAPKVPAEEMKQAVRWRIKELVDFNVNDAAIDIIHLPQDAFRGRQQMVYVVAAAHKVVEEAEKLVNGAGLKLRYLDIAELSLCNLLDGFDTESHGCALMYLSGGEGVLNLVKHNALYLSRKVKVDLNMIDTQDPLGSSAFNHLLLETQRSLDYYESQLGQAPATELLLLPVGDQGQPLGDALNANLGLNAHLLDLPQFLPGTEQLSEQLLQRSLLAIAGAIRRNGL